GRHSPQLLAPVVGEAGLRPVELEVPAGEPHAAVDPELAHVVLGRPAVDPLVAVAVARLAALAVAHRGLAGLAGPGALGSRSGGLGRAAGLGRRAAARLGL